MMGYGRGEFGTGEDWVKFMENEVQDLKNTKIHESIEIIGYLKKIISLI